MTRGIVGFGFIRSYVGVLGLFSGKDSLSVALEESLFLNSGTRRHRHNWFLRVGRSRVFGNFLALLVQVWCDLLVDVLGFNLAVWRLIPVVGGRRSLRRVLWRRTPGWDSPIAHLAIRCFGS